MHCIQKLCMGLHGNITLIARNPIEEFRWHRVTVKVYTWTTCKERTLVSDIINSWICESPNATNIGVFIKVFPEKGINKVLWYNTVKLPLPTKVYYRSVKLELWGVLNVNSLIFFLFSDSRAWWTTVELIQEKTIFLMWSVQICRDQEGVAETLNCIYCALVLLPVQLCWGCFKQYHCHGQTPPANSGIHWNGQNQPPGQAVSAHSSSSHLTWKGTFFLPASQSDWDTLLESALATNHHQPYDPKTTAEDTYCVSFVPHLL